MHICRLVGRGMDPVGFAPGGAWRALAFLVWCRSLWIVRLDAYHIKKMLESGLKGIFVINEFALTQHPAILPSILRG